MWPERVLSGGFWWVSGVKVEFEYCFGAAMHRKVGILGKCVHKPNKKVESPPEDPTHSKSNLNHRLGITCSVSNNTPRRL